MEQFIISNFSFGLGSVLIGITAFVMLNLGLVIFLGSKDVAARAFAFLTFVVVLWSIFNLLMTATLQMSHLGRVFGRLAYSTGLFVSLSLSYFCFVHATKQRNMLLEITYVLVALFSTCFLVFTNGFFMDDRWIREVASVGVQVWGIADGPFSFVYYFFYVGSVVLGLVVLRIKAKQEQDMLRKKQLLNMFWIVLIGIVPPTITSIVLPALYVFEYDWIGGVLGIFWVSITSYFLLKKDQTEQVFPVMIVKAELLVIALIFIFGIGMFY
jgi:hypothetical protein